MSRDPLRFGPQVQFRLKQIILAEPHQKEVSKLPHHHTLMYSRHHTLTCSHHHTLTHSRAHTITLTCSHHHVLQVLLKDLEEFAFRGCPKALSYDTAAEGEHVRVCEV